MTDTRTVTQFRAADKLGVGMKLDQKFPRMSQEMSEKVRGFLEVGCACGGETARLTQRKINASVTVHLQCCGCGASLSGGLKRTEHFFFQDYPDWNGELRDEWQRGFERERARLGAQKAWAHEERRTEYRVEAGGRGGAVFSFAGSAGR